MCASYVNLYLRENTADVHFTFDCSNEKVPAHRSVLAVGSVVFAKLFNGTWNTGDHVHLSGKRPEIFKDFLKFFYHCANDLDLGTIMHVMEYLHEYQCDESLKCCADYWMHNGTIDDACLAYAYAIHFEIDEFQRTCERKISIECAEIFKTDTFLASPYHVVDKIVQLQTLICDEKHVLNAILQWARFQCQQQNKDGDDTQNIYQQLTNGAVNLLHKIRYQSMSIIDFVAIMDSNGGLFRTIDEYEDVLRLLAGTQNTKTGKFTMQPRKVHLWPTVLSEINFATKEKKQTHYHDLELLWGLSKYLLHFNVNKSILWYGFEIVKIKTDLPNEFSFKISIEDQSSSTIVHAEIINGINSHVKFKRPVFLRSKIIYAIHLNFPTMLCWDHYDEADFRDKSYRSENVTINAATDGGCLVKKIKFNTVDSFLSI